MADFKATKVTNEKYLPSAAPHSSREVHEVSDHVVLTNALAQHDLIWLGVLPPNCIPASSFLLYSSDLDTGGPTIVLTVGILNSDQDDLVPYSTIVLSSTIAQGGGIAVPNSNLFMIPVTWLAEATCPDLMVKKYIAAHVDTAATTPAAGTMDVMFSYRSAEGGI